MRRWVPTVAPARYVSHSRGARRRRQARSTRGSCGAARLSLSGLRGTRRPARLDVQRGERRSSHRQAVHRARALGRPQAAVSHPGLSWLSASRARRRAPTVTRADLCVGRQGAAMATPAARHRRREGGRLDVRSRRWPPDEGAPVASRLRERVSEMWRGHRRGSLSRTLTYCAFAASYLCHA